MTGRNGSGSQPSHSAYDPAAEEAVIGSCLIDPQAVDRVTPDLTPADFFIDRNRWAFEAIIDLDNRGIPVDLVVLSNELKQRGRLDEIGGPGRLMELINTTPAAGMNAEYYASIVLEMAAQRRKGKIINEAGKAMLAGDLAEAARILQAAAEPEHDTQGPTVKPLIEQFEHVSAALEPREPTPYLIEGHIPAKALIGLYGRPGEHKTNYSLELAFSIASGQDHLISEPPAMTNGRKVTQAGVLLGDVDSGRDVLLERYSAFSRARGLSLNHLPFHFVSFPDPPLNAARGLGELINSIRFYDARFVVLDNLLRIAGVPDENSPLMDSAMSALRGAVEATGATICFIHHPTKNRIAGDVIDGDDLRGHGSILAAVDLALRIRRTGDVITIKPTKSRRAMPETLSARFYFQQKADGVTLDECRFFACESPESTAAREVVNKRRQAIRDALATGKLTYNMICAAVKGGRNDIKSDLSAMVLAGEIDLEPGARGATIYSLKG